MLKTLRRFASPLASIVHPALMRLILVYARLRYGPDLQPYTVFPQRPAGARNKLGHSGELYPDPAAPDCTAVPVHRADWIETTPPIPTARASRISLRLPPEYKARSLEPVMEEPGEHWGHILGSWEVTRAEPVRPGYPERHFTLWIGSTAGYPTLGASPQTRQLAFAECQVRTIQPTLHLVRFTLRMPHQGVQHHIAATWTIAEDVHLQATGSGPDLAAQDELAAIAQSLRVAAP